MFGPRGTGKTTLVRERDAASLRRFQADLGNCEAFCLSRDPHEKRIGEVRFLPWQRGLEELGL